MLLSNLDLLATAPGGVARLRELILTLAVQGKLVPQDPADEPASVLLQKIRAEKNRLIAEGKIKRDKPLAEIAEEEKPFELPDGWKWARLAELAYPQAGFAFKSDGFNEARLGLPLIRIRDVGDNDPATFFSGAFREEFVVSRGDWLISMDGEFRVREWRGPEALLNQRVTRLIFFGDELFQPFVSTALQFRLHELQGTKAYTTVDHLSGGQIAAAFIPLPPLAEQSRIVTRVEELMHLCDAMEDNGQLEATQHAQLVSILLGTLTASNTPKDLADNWQRVAQHFDLLLDRPEAIDALEQTLLQLAVRGLLVPQESADEPASALLARISAEKDRLIAEGKIKRDKPLQPITDEEKPFELPEGWEWARMGEVFDGGSGTTPLRTRTDFFLDGTEMWVKTTDLTNSLVTTCEELITKAAVEENRLRYFPSGTVCVAMYGGAGTIGKSGVLGVSSTINQSVFALPPTEGMNVDFLHTYVITVRPRWMSFAAGLRKDPNINGQIIKKMVMPVPPSAEQSRIVTQVTALRRLCTDLRHRLKAAQATQSHLAQALVEYSNAL